MLKDSVIIEARGGAVEKVSATTALKIILIDYDNYEGSDNIVETANQLAQGQIPGRIVPHHEVRQFILDLLAPAQTCPDCSREYRDPAEFTYLADHGKCYACHRKWQTGGVENHG